MRHFVLTLLLPARRGAVIIVSHVMAELHGFVDSTDWMSTLLCLPLEPTLLTNLASGPPMPCAVWWYLSWYGLDFVTRAARTTLSNFYYIPWS